MREDGTLSRAHFTFDKDRNVYFHGYRAGVSSRGDIRWQTV